MRTSDRASDDSSSAYQNMGRERRSGRKFFGCGPKSSYFFLPPSSAMYMISCLKMKRFGAPSRVRRIMFLS